MKVSFRLFLSLLIEYQWNDDGSSVGSPIVLIWSQLKDILHIISQISLYLVYCINYMLPYSLPQYIPMP
jgi:hypothetical protein